MTLSLVWTVPTPDGPFSAITDADGVILASGWTASTTALLQRRPAGITPDAAPRPVPADEAPGLGPAAVAAFYDGDVARILTVPVRHAGTPLRLELWTALRSIPAGHPLTYTQLAAAVGRPAAIRPAAGACAANAPALFVPCHRVLRSDGTLGGFAWGVEVKSRLLAREQGPLG